MSKRPAINLAELTAEVAAPMTEAVQRAPRPSASAPFAVVDESAPARSAEATKVKTENLQALAFKVPPAFRKRFRQHAANADLKLNELLFEALDAWEDKKGIRR
ncbi:MAG: hypothetical protein ACP5QR_15585 [Rhizomicrobium sp.]